MFFFEKSLPKSLTMVKQKSLIEISVLLVDGKQQVKFALNVDTNGVNLI